MMARTKKPTDKHIPAPNPAHEDFWDEDNVHDLQQMVAEAAEPGDETVGPST